MHSPARLARCSLHPREQGRGARQDDLPLSLCQSHLCAQLAQQRCIMPSADCNSNSTIAVKYRNFGSHQEWLQCRHSCGNAEVVLHLRPRHHVLLALLVLRAESAYLGGCLENIHWSAASPTILIEGMLPAVPSLLAQLLHDSSCLASLAACWLRAQHDTTLNRHMRTLLHCCTDIA